LEIAMNWISTIYSNIYVTAMLQDGKRHAFVAEANAPAAAPAKASLFAWIIGRR
jgi:hypothetical protein